MIPTHVAGRHPIEVGTLAACVGCGLVHIVVPAPGSAVHAAMGPVISIAWGAVFALGALLALTGVYWRGGIEASLHLERAGLVAVVGALAAALAAIVVRVPTIGDVAASLVVGIGGGMVVRVCTISRVIAHATAAARVRRMVYDDAGVLDGDGGDRLGDERRAGAPAPVVDGTPQERRGHGRDLHSDGGNAGDEGGAGGGA